MYLRLWFLNQLGLRRSDRRFLWHCYHVRDFHNSGYAVSVGHRTMQSDYKPYPVLTLMLTYTYLSFFSKQRFIHAP